MHEIFKTKEARYVYYERESLLHIFNRNQKTSLSQVNELLYNCNPRDL